ncbi:MAG: hypothetical protein E7404_04175 [Ruminococcaceae bacterium]|nr:hypothetical protein [Oscillospiraceae bacterium]
MKNMFKKAVCLVACLTLVATLLCPGFSVFATEGELDLVFDFAEDFTGLETTFPQGTNNWYFLYRKIDGSNRGALTEMSNYKVKNANSTVYRYYGEGSTWISGSKDDTAASMFATHLARAATDSQTEIHRNIALKFKSPYNGSATIDTKMFKGNSAYTDLKVTLTLNGELIWPSDDEYYRYKGTVDYDFPAMTLDLKADDELVFEFESYYLTGATQTGVTDSLGTPLDDKTVNQDNQRIYFQPTITYAEGAIKPLDNLVFNASVNYAGEQGLNNWYYAYRTVDNGEESELQNYTYFSSWNGGRWSKEKSLNYGVITGPSDTSAVNMMITSPTTTYVEGTTADTLFYNPARVFVSPYNGTAKITADTLKGKSLYSRMKVRILKNNVQIWPSNGWFDISGNTTEYASQIGDLSVNLKFGDKLVFEAQRGTVGVDLTTADLSDGKQTVKWIPVITYSSDATLPVYETVFNDTFKYDEENLCKWNKSIENNGATYNFDNEQLNLNSIVEDVMEDKLKSPVCGVYMDMPYANGYIVEFDMTIKEGYPTTDWQIYSGFQFSFHRQQDSVDYNVFFDAARAGQELIDSQKQNIVWRANGGVGKSRISSNVEKWDSGDTDTTYAVKLTIKDYTATLEVNNSTYTYTYTDPLYAAGGIELRAVRCDAVIDNFKITGIKEGLSIGDVSLVSDTNKITATSTVKVPLDFDVKKDINMITAVYNAEDNTLIAVAVDSITATVANGRVLTCEAESADAIADGAKVKVFFWDNDSTSNKYLSPLKAVLETTKAQITN